ncbi:MAG: DUF721 domain-containing protein [Bacteroidetes bacterium]|jgi:hypothetical protein|nr:DUF721 domain-containing protein [Bacteroidota bacterium]
MSKGNENKIGELLKKMVDRGDGWSEKIQSERLKNAWKKCMGPMIHGYTHKIYFSKGTLYVKLTSSVLRHELTVGKEKLRTNLNNEIGQELVEKLVIR